MTHYYSLEYSLIFYFLIASIILAIIIIALSYIASYYNPDNEKLSSYECGFEPYDDARNHFDVHFYIVALLFLVFDLETVFSTLDIRVDMTHQFEYALEQEKDLVEYFKGKHIENPLDDKAFEYIEKKWNITRARIV